MQSAVNNPHLLAHIFHIFAEASQTQTTWRHSVAVEKAVDMVRLKNRLEIPIRDGGLAVNNPLY